MHDQTKAELVDGGTSLIGTLLKDFLTRRGQRQQMEQRKDMELELAEVRQQHTGDDGGGGDPTPDPRPDGRTRELQQAFEDLKAGEDCTTCRQLLEPMEDLPPRKQLVALTEYGRFKQAMHDGADKERLEAIIRESDVLHDLFKESMGGL